MTVPSLFALSLKPTNGMTQMNTSLKMIAAVVFTFTAVAPAEDNQPVVIQWKTLAPAESAQYRDPFAKLSRQQLQRLGFVVRIQNLIAVEKISPDGESAVEAAKIAGQLKKQGVDIPWLMAQREHVTLLREKQEQTVTNSIAKKFYDKRVKLTGFAVPLKTVGGRITEFYLVPSFATCSHSSAPPANEVVYVSTESGIVINGRRSSVTVVGKVTAKQTIRFIPSAAGPKKITAAYVIVPEQAEVIALAE